MELCLARDPPQVCAPTRHNHPFSHLRVISEFWQNFFKTPCVPDECIYRSAVFVWEDPIPNASFDIILSRKKFSKFFEIFFCSKLYQKIP